MTAMSEALERAGFRKEEMEIYPALIRFFKSGGSLARLGALAQQAATEILGEGQRTGADTGQASLADVQYQTRNEGQMKFAQSSHRTSTDVPHPLPGGQTGRADFGQTDFAPGQPDTSEGQKRFADKANAGVPSAGAPIASEEAKQALPTKAGVEMPPAREPSTVQIQSARYAADLTFNEIVKLRGRMLDLYRFKDLKNVRHLNNYENAIINDCIDYGRQHRINENHKIGLSIPRSEIQKIVNRAKTAIQSKALLTMPKSKRGRSSSSR